MNDKNIMALCLSLPRRECEKQFGISQKLWEHVRHYKQMPEDRRGRPRDTQADEQILKVVNEHPSWPSYRVALEVGCSDGKVQMLFREMKLTRSWQRRAWAGKEMKEMEPDLAKARRKENRIKADGPGALVQVDCKRYHSLKGGKAQEKLIVGVMVIDSFSGFCNLFIIPDGRKTAANIIKGLEAFKQAFPAPIQVIYTDNGKEFDNKAVYAWCEANCTHTGQKHKFTKKAHAWSNGKTERTQGMFREEVTAPLLETKEYTTVAEFADDLVIKGQWWNFERPHFGWINRGLTPGKVVEHCTGMNFQMGFDTITELVKEQKSTNRREWEKERVRQEKLSYDLAVSEPDEEADTAFDG
jgi:transposase InsO family protein